MHCLNSKTNRAVPPNECLPEDKPQNTSSCRVPCKAPKRTHHRYKWRRGPWSRVKYRKRKNHTTRPADSNIHVPELNINLTPFDQKKNDVLLPTNYLTLNNKIDSRGSNYNKLKQEHQQRGRVLLENHIRLRNTIRKRRRKQRFRQNEPTAHSKHLALEKSIASLLARKKYRKDQVLPLLHPIVNGNYKDLLNSSAPLFADSFRERNISHHPSPPRHIKPSNHLKLHSPPYVSSILPSHYRNEIDIPMKDRSAHHNILHQLYHSQTDSSPLLPTKTNNRAREAYMNILHSPLKPSSSPIPFSHRHHPKPYLY